LLSTRQSSIDDLVSTMVRPPSRATAKMSARRPSGSGISRSTEWPAWRIIRHAPRQTARVMSGRVCIRQGLAGGA
jgi:hypothetical protein